MERSDRPQKPESLLICNANLPPLASASHDALHAVAPLHSREHPSAELSLLGELRGPSDERRTHGLDALAAAAAAGVLLPVASAASAVFERGARGGPR